MASLAPIFDGCNERDPVKIRRKREKEERRAELIVDCFGGRRGRLIESLRVLAILGLRLHPRFIGGKKEDS